MSLMRKSGTAHLTANSTKDVALPYKKIVGAETALHDIKLGRVRAYPGNVLNALALCLTQLSPERRKAIMERAIAVLELKMAETDEEIARAQDRLARAGGPEVFVPAETETMHRPEEPLSPRIPRRGGKVNNSE
jgi:hypothetical protein